MSAPLSTEQANLLLEQADAARKTSHVDEAVRLYKKVGSDTQDKDLVATSADGLQACGRQDIAVDILESALERWPQSPMLRMRAVITYESSGNFRGAVRHLTWMTEFAPHKSRYWTWLGKTCLTLSDWSGAEAAFSKALSISPMDSAAALGRGDALFQLGRFEEAVTSYRRAVNMFPDNLEAALKLGNVLSSLGNAQEAIRTLRHAITLHPKSAAAHMSLGTALHYGSGSEDALSYCQKAVQLDPELTIAREALGLVLLDLGQIGEAREALQAVGQEHASISGLLARYRIAMEDDNIQAAERALHRILTQDSSHGEARHLLAALHGEPLAQPFPGFVDSLFARLALRYDQRMVGDLKYDLPDKVVQEIENLGYEAGSFSRLLDLGCGTGLIAKALQKSFEIGERTGMDLCRGMLVQAAQGGHYHLLIQGDVLTAMGEASGMYDLITAVDLIPYIGDLTNLGIQIADRMTERGLVVLTHETATSRTYKINPSGRFSHSDEYVDNVLQRAGLSLKAKKPVTLRYDKGEEVPGRLAVYSLT